MSLRGFMDAWERSVRYQEARDRAAEPKPRTLTPEEAKKRLKLDKEWEARREELKRDAEKLHPPLMGRGIIPVPKGDPMARAEPPAVSEAEQARCKTLTWAEKHALQYMSVGAQRRARPSGDHATEWGRFATKAELGELLHGCRFAFKEGLHHVDYQSLVEDLVRNWNDGLHTLLVEHIEHLKDVEGPSAAEHARLWRLLEREKAEAKEAERRRAEALAEQERLACEALERAEFEADLAELTLREEHPELGSW